MLRPIACVALLVSALIPGEQPAVQAKNWQPVLNGDFCVDYDSEKIDGDWITWSYNKCAKSRVAQMAKVNCRDWAAKGVTHSWYEYDKKAATWREETLDSTSQQDDLVMVECIGSWMVGGRSSPKPGK